MSATLAAGVAGCTGGSGSGGESTRDCQSGAVAHGDGDLLDGGAMAVADDGAVVLQVPLSVDRVENTGVERLEVTDANGDLEYVVPVSANDADVMANKRGVSQGQLLYEQHLGARPQHGEFRVAATDGDGATVDTITIEFNCFADVQE